MKFKEMIETLKTAVNERVEIRNSDNCEICNVPVATSGLNPYLDCDVVSWFPSGAPGRNATFTVLLDIGGEKE